MNDSVEEVHVAVGHFPFVALVLVILTAVALPHIVRIVRSIQPAEAFVRVHWTIAHVVIVALAMIGTPFVVSLVFPLPREGLGLLLWSSTTMLVPVALAVHYAYRLDPRRLGAIGLRSGAFFTSPIAGVVAFVLTLPGLMALAFVWMWVLSQIGFEVEEQLIVRELASLVGGERWIAAALGVLVQPFFEELLFRGFLQPVLVQKLRPSVGIALTSILFAGLHGGTAFAPIFALSCLLGFVMMHTQRLHAAWAVHALFNGLQFLAMYAFPEVIKHAAPPGGLVQLLTR